MAAPLGHTVLASTDGAAFASLRHQATPRAERYAIGRELRRTVPRSALATWNDDDREADPVQQVIAGNEGRVDRLIPVRIGRMVANPFAFLRGAAAVMATDLAGQPIAGIPVQAGGDSHLMNFGAFVTPENNILFDVNDFDETLPGVDFTVDLKRLAASVAVAALQTDVSK